MSDSDGNGVRPFSRSESRPDDAVIDGAVDQRALMYLQYQRLAQRVREMAEEVAEEHLIRCSVQHRIKSADRLQKKLLAWRDKGKLDGFTDAGKILGRVRDIAAVRITTYLDRDRERMLEKLRDRFKILIEERKDRNDSLYRAIHLDVSLLPEDLESQEDRALSGMACEVQICTLLSHVYSEIEHDLRYKPLSGEISVDEKRLLDALGHLTLTGDQIILSLIERTEDRVRSNASSGRAEVSQSDPLDIMAILSPKLTFLSKPRDYASSVLRFLESIGLRTATEIEDRLIDGDVAERWLALKQRVEVHEKKPEGGFGTRTAPYAPESADGLILLAVERLAPEIRTFFQNRRPGRPSREVTLAHQLLDGPFRQG